MKILVAKNSGFCGGVQRAFILVEKRFKEKKQKGNVFILGSLVHNENVAEKVKQWGIKKITTIRPAKKGDIVIITAHGVSKQKIEALEKRGVEVFDVTCANVSIVHKYVADHFEKGFEIIIFGDRQHKEIKGINGWCNNNAKIIGDMKETKALVKKISLSKRKRPILLVSQTTQNFKLFEEVTKLLENAAKDADRKFKMIDTICRATSLRQEEAVEIAKKSKGIVVIGGKSSANTRQLWKIAKKINSNVVWIERLDSKAKASMRKKFEKLSSVGVISGASTPKWDINDTIAYLESF